MRCRPFCGHAGPTSIPVLRHPTGFYINATAAFASGQLAAKVAHHLVYVHSTLAALAGLTALGLWFMIWFSTDITFIVWLLFRLVAVGFDLILASIETLSGMNAR